MNIKIGVGIRVWRRKNKKKKRKKERKKRHMDEKIK